MTAEGQPGFAIPEGEAELTLEEHGRLDQHPTELAEVHGVHAHRQPWPRSRDVDAQDHLAVEVVLTADRTRSDHEVEVGLVLGHAPDAFATLDRDLTADW